MKQTKVMVVIPTYNEAGNVAQVTRALAKIFAQSKAYDFHILFVDDNSPDGTGTQIDQLIQKYKFVHILRNKRKGGLGHAYKKGFAYAIDRYQTDIIFQFDSDLQHDESIIPLMLRDIEQGSDLVLGSRYIPGGSIPEAWPIYRKFLSVVGNLYIRFIMFHFSVHDWTTGYRAVKSSVAKEILPSMGNSAFNGYTYQIGFLVKSIQKGYKVSEVAFHFRDRKEGMSKLGPEYIFNTMRYIMKVRMSEILNSRIFKFLVTGGTGTMVQIIALYFYRFGLAYQLANFLSIETAIVSNFTLSNLWTFADRKLEASQIPAKFVQFNMASAGSILIQMAVAFVGERFIGLYSLFTLPIVAIHIDTGLIFSVVGILIGMFWNFFAYSRFVWRSPERSVGKKK